ncbi:MAG: hypothetical protein C0631_02895 [Sedimenticola sp.]|nr:MAG: hypothetical protein C0631_02895 [Sedimenticola sp.]
MSITYLTTEELSERIKYDSRYIREKLNDTVLIEGTHYVRPFGRRKILYLWERIEQDFIETEVAIPLRAGGICRG